MAEKKISGYQATLYSGALGTLVEGDAATALTDDSWYMINAVKATGSELPDLGLTAFFKSPKNSGDAVTPALGDNMYPVTLTEMARVDVSMSTSKGVIDLTDSGDSGYVSSITDGFSDISGSINGFLRFNDPTGGLVTLTKATLSRFFDVVSDSGAGVYGLTAKNDDNLYLFNLLNSEDTDTGCVQTYLIVSVILTATANNQPLKGGQNLDLTWQKAQGWAGLYERTIVAAT